MGWARGAGLLRRILQSLGTLTEAASADAKYELFDDLVDLFEREDADTLGELEQLDPIMDQVLRDRGHIESSEVDQEEPTVWMFVHNVREHVDPSRAQCEMAAAHFETLRSALRHVCSIMQAGVLRHDQVRHHAAQAMREITQTPLPDDR